MVQKVLGSEVFANRPTAREFTREKLGGNVSLHSVPAEILDQVDPLTYEVVRHRLWSITEEMGEAIKKMSGSVVVTDANDFNFAVMDELGDEVQIGLYNTELCASMDMAVKWTLENRSANPGIREGDMFLCNDPWVGGGIHQNDVSVFAPFFCDGKLFAWTAAVAHQVDLGGVSPGSWTPRAESVFWESLPTPPVKIVENGTIRRDIEDVYLRRSRTPRLIALDLRAKIGANNVGHERLKSLIRKYGSDAVKAVMYRMMDDAEKRLRAKLRSLPDGTWNAVAYQDQAKEGDRNIYKIVVSMTKRDDHLIFDFRGTDPQAGMINCTYAGMRGGIVAPLLAILAGDIPWYPGGIHRCYEIVSDEGTLTNCVFPAAISKASVASCWATANAVTECLSNMLNTRAEYGRNTMSVCQGTWDLILLSGIDQYHSPFVTMLMDPMAGGLGARADMDGVDTGGELVIPMGRIPDVEMNEFSYPILYLWRREEKDSGGPGKYRGGLSGSSCFVVYDSPGGQLHLVVSHSGKALPMSNGISGGYPANTAYDVLIRDSNVKALMDSGKLPGRLEDIQGNCEIIPPEGETDFFARDVYYTCWQGGGGHGDPLLRNPQRVQSDVREQKVSVEAARDIYGVSLEGETLEVDSEKTAGFRDELRRKRSGQKPAIPIGKYRIDQREVQLRMDDNLVATTNNQVLCVHCGTCVAMKGEHFLQRAAKQEMLPSMAGPHIRDDAKLFVDQEVVLRQYYCPGCFTALHTEIVPRQDETYVRKVW
jgi:N-methylhydantoinase B